MTGAPIEPTADVAAEHTEQQASEVTSEQPPANTPTADTDSPATPGAVVQHESAESLSATPMPLESASAPSPLPVGMPTIPQKAEIPWHDGTTGTQLATSTPGALRENLPYFHLSNLLRGRWWWFSLGGSLLVTVLIAMLFPPFVVAWPVMFGLMGLFWLTQQMACRACGKRLPSSSPGSDGMVCPHCGSPTVKALRQQQR